MQYRTFITYFKVFQHPHGTCINFCQEGLSVPRGFLMHLRMHSQNNLLAKSHHLDSLAPNIGVTSTTSEGIHGPLQLNDLCKRTRSSGFKGVLFWKPSNLKVLNLQKTHLCTPWFPCGFSSLQRACWPQSHRQLFFPR